MATLDEVYRKFGEASEAAQLLETELGTLLLKSKFTDAGLVESPDPTAATKIYRRVSKQTLGTLIRSLGTTVDGIDETGKQLADALDSRNRLAHTFYLEHNNRRNSDSGRDVMLRDLESIHEDMLAAYKSVLRLTGIDLERLVRERVGEPLPTGHLNIPT